MTTPTTVERDYKPMPQNAVDPNAKVPPSVAAAAARAAEIHKQAYPEPVKVADTPVPPVVETPVAPVASVVVEPVRQPDPPVEPAPENMTAEQWQHRYNSMKGRYDATSRQLGVAQEQLSQMGHELTQTQSMLAHRGDNTPPQPPLTSSLLTDADVKDFGPDVIDFAKRAAMEAVTPELNALKKQNQQLNQKLGQSTSTNLWTALRAAVPDADTINTDERFRNWLSLRDVYSGMIRGELLKAAFTRGDTARVIAFFRGFVSDEVATGNREAPTLLTPAAAPVAPVPPAPAVDLGALTAPGRAKPATGDSAVPASKPTYSRAQIAQNYRDKSKGLWSGREAEFTRLEQDMIAAGREGRVRG